MRISIDTDVDTFDSAIRAVHAAYGVPFDSSVPAVQESKPEDVDDDEGPEEEDDFFPGKWNRKRIRKLAQWVTPDAAEALRYIAENAPAVDLDQVLVHMAEYTGIEGFNGQNMGGRMSSVGFAQNSIKAGVGDIYDTDYKHRKYRMDKGIAKVLLEEFEALSS